jgi:hypothetical protein
MYQDGVATTPLSPVEAFRLHETGLLMLVDYEQARNSYRFRSVEASEHKEQLSFEMGFWSSFVHPLAHEQGQSALSALCGFCRAWR